MTCVVACATAAMEVSSKSGGVSLSVLHSMFKVRTLLSVPEARELCHHARDPRLCGCVSGTCATW